MTRLSNRRDERGMTLLELVISAAIMAVLAAAAMPLMEVSVRRGREVELRYGLRVLRRAIDDFHLSFVASGGKPPQGQTILPGRATPGGAPGAASNISRSATSSQGGADAGEAGQPGGAAQPGGRLEEIDLIDVSQFDAHDMMGYPPTLMLLAEGVDPVAGASDVKVKFLRRIPFDPMLDPTTIKEGDGNQGWGVRSYQMDLDETGWDRMNVYDVFTKSQGRALDGSFYRDW